MIGYLIHSTMQIYLMVCGEALGGAIHVPDAGKKFNGNGIGHEIS